MSSDNNLNQKILKAGMWYVISQILVRGISFLSTPIYARLLTTEQMGVITIFESWLRVFLPIITLSLYASVERAKYDFKEEFDSYISAIQTLIMIIIAIVSVVIIPFHEIVGSALSMTDMMLIIMMLYLVTQAAVNCVQRREKVMLQYKTNIIITFFASVLPTIVSVIIMVYVNKVHGQDMMVPARILGFYVPQIVVGIFVIALLMVRGKVYYKRRYWSYGLAFSIPLIPHVLSMEILNQSDKIMVEKILGEYDAGIFSLATKVMWILLLLSQAVGEAWIPWIYEKLDKKEYTSIQRPWTFLMHGMGIVTWLMVMLAPELVYIMGGEKYNESICLVAPLLSSVIAHFFSYNYISIEQFYKKNSQIAMASMIVVVLNIILNYICINKWGYIAAAYTTAVCYLLLVIIHGCLIKWCHRETIVSIKSTVGLTVVYYAINMISMYTYRYSRLVRYSFMFLVIILIFAIFYKRLKQIVNVFMASKRKD